MAFCSAGVICMVMTVVGSHSSLPPLPPGLAGGVVPCSSDPEASLALLFSAGTGGASVVLISEGLFKSEEQLCVLLVDSVV